MQITEDFLVRDIIGMDIQSQHSILPVGVGRAIISVVQSCDIDTGGV